MEDREISLKDAYREGAKAYDAGQSALDNPHTFSLVQPSEYSEWRRGYYERMDR